MKTHLILLLSLAVASLAMAADSPESPQAVMAVPNPQEATTDQQRSDSVQDHKVGKPNEEEEDPSLAYVVDPSKKSTRGYDENGRQEVVNVGPGMKTTADGQTQSRTGPRGRQRGAVLPHKYIVRLKNGADFSSFNMQSKVKEHNRLIRLPSKDGDTPDGQQKVEQENAVPNQVDHEYDFGTWKGYAGQFSSDFLKELEAHDEVEYVEEDTLMWAWGVPEQGGSDEENEQAYAVEDLGLKDTPLDAVGESTLEKVGAMTNETEAFEADAMVNGRNIRLEYYSLKAPSWGLTRISQRQRDLFKDYSYMASAGSGVDVYIIDSGVYAEHSDFGGRATNLANFVPGEAGTDTCGHGTHVAGIVGGRRYGVAKGAHINAVKVLDAEGQGSTSQVLAGINYVIKHAYGNPNPRKVINMSLGGQFSRPVNDAVRVAVSRYGLPFFVAAGNTGDDACQYSPAGVEEAFAVGGSDRSDKVGWYSCVGSCVNIFAPGSGIASDWIRSSTSAHVLDGTSMASPHVAGVAALFLGAGNTYNSAQDLYSDLIRHSTQGIINGLPSFDRKTSKNLLYNKLEDISAYDTVQPQDQLFAEDEKDSKAEGKKKEHKAKSHRAAHPHH